MRHRLTEPFGWYFSSRVGRTIYACKARFENYEYTQGLG